MNMETPYLEDNNRKGATHGEAIFGDKQAQFELPSQTTESSVTAAGQAELDYINEQESKHLTATNHLGELAAQHAIALNEYANQHPDATDEQLAKIASHLG